MAVRRSPGIFTHICERLKPVRSESVSAGFPAASVHRDAKIELPLWKLNPKTAATRRATSTRARRDLEDVEDEGPGNEYG
jgi:hypothetical protein